MNKIYCYPLESFLLKLQQIKDVIVLLLIKSEINVT